MPSILFDVPVPSPNEDQVYKVIVSQSDTISGIKTEIVNVLYSTLGTDPNTGKVILTDPLINTSKHNWVRFESSTGSSSKEVYMAPLPSSSQVTTIVGNLVELDGTGSTEKVRVRLTNGYFVVGTTIVTDTAEKIITLQNGIFSIDVQTGAIIEIIYSKHKNKVSIDTTGLGGQTIDLSTYIAQHNS